MSRLRAALLIACCIALTTGGLLFFRLAMPELFRPVPAAFAAGVPKPPGRIRFAVLGDSSAQSYHDTLMLGDPGLRGGHWRATTWQWTEILARLRGDQIDFGQWGAWGEGKYRALLGEAFGELIRSPRKDDYRYNFAVNGSQCNELLGHSQRQAIRLVELMDARPQEWRGGIVLIRMGANDIGLHDPMDELARDPASSHIKSVIDTCVATIGRTVSLIRKRHPDTYVVVVGVPNTADWPDELGSWQSARETANIKAGLDRFDNGLHKLAAADRDVYFLDDRAWFRGLWGSRDDHGFPHYKTVRLSPGWAITHTIGDDPHNAVVADGHAGVVLNVLWAQHLINVVNSAFGLTLRPITDDEVVRFLQPNFAGG